MMTKTFYDTDATIWFFFRKQTDRKPSSGETTSSAFLLSNVASQFESLAKSVRNRPVPVEPKSDKTDIFAKYLASKLREVPEERRSLVEQKLLQIVFENIV